MLSPAVHLEVKKVESMPADARCAPHAHISALNSNFQNFQAQRAYDDVQPVEVRQAGGSSPSFAVPSSPAASAYWLAEDAQGQGLATAALREAVEIAFRRRR